MGTTDPSVLNLEELFPLWACHCPALRLASQGTFCGAASLTDSAPRGQEHSCTSLWVPLGPPPTEQGLSGRVYLCRPACWGPTQSCLLAQHPLVFSHALLLGLSYRWLLNEFPNFIPADGRHFVSQTTGNLYIARTNASDLGNYSCLATSHMDFSTKSVFSKFAQLNLAAEGQGQGMWRAGFSLRGCEEQQPGGRVPGPRSRTLCYKTPDACLRHPREGELRWS